MHGLRVVLIVILLVAIAGCQRAGSLRVAPAETAVQPRQVAVADTDGYTGHQVAWGGLVIGVHNLKDRTRLEVLAYPLDRDGAPDVDAAPTGRFLADYFGFLDPADHGPGRRMTVRGTVSGIRSGKVGDADYRYPVVETAEVRLWPAQTADSYYPGPHFHIGIGVYKGF